MSLTLYYHPLASFCHKVQLALYENATPFVPRVVDLADADSSAVLRAHWAVGKIPVLHDAARDRWVAETSIIIEYLMHHHPGTAALLPAEVERALEVRLWDRFFDLYVQVPMQKVVADTFRPAGRDDAIGVEEARATLRTAYGMLEQQLVHGRKFAVGDDYTLADCAATPALFYAQPVVPFADDHPRVSAYFERLIARPSFARVLCEARPYFGNFPLRERLQERFLHD